MGRHPFLHKAPTEPNPMIGPKGDLQLVPCQVQVLLQALEALKSERFGTDYWFQIKPVWELTVAHLWDMQAWFDEHAAWVRGEAPYDGRKGDDVPEFVRLCQSVGMSKEAIETRQRLFGDLDSLYGPTRPPRPADGDADADGEV